MEQVYLDTLSLIGCAVRGEQAVLRPDADLRRILSESQKQDCSMCVTDAILTAAGELSAPEQGKLKTVLFQNAARELRRRIQIERLLRQMEERGLQPVLIKGMRLAQFYPKPILREAVDTDLFFSDPDQMRQAQEFLIADGAQLYAPSAGKHSVLTHPRAGHFELHERLYSEETQNTWLANERPVSEPTERIRLSNGTEVSTLGKTDTLKYTFAHFFNHFLYDRFTLRQMADLLLIVRSCGAALDREELHRFLNAIGQEELFRTVMAVGIRYMGFTPGELLQEKAPDAALAKSAELLLTDCFQGGIKGRPDDPFSGRGIGAVGSKLAKSGKKQLHIAAAHLKRVLCPSRKLLQSLFPYCAEHSCLLPAAWVQNLYCTARGAQRARKRFSRRKELLRRLHIEKK